MSKEDLARIRDSLSIIWVITAKDIVDALKNKLIISLMIMGSVTLLLPKLLPYIFEQPAPVVPVYGEGAAGLAASLRDDPDLSVLPVGSEDEFRQALCGALFPQIGLLLPPDFDQLPAAGEPIQLQGAVCWSRRFQVSALQPKLETLLSHALGRPVTIRIDENIVYPPPDRVLMMSMAVINSVVVILMIGIVLVPNLLFEEKQAKTLDALMVSPASISQVVIGKALAGLFYILVTALMVFAISWADVVHWGVAVIFVVTAGVFAVAVGLVLGSFFEKPQDVAGWSTLLLVVVIGAIFVKMIHLDLPPVVESILPWTPSVALAELCRAAFAGQVPAGLIANNVWIVLMISLPLYALVVWKIRRSDR